MMEVGNHSGASWVPKRDNASEKSVKTNATKPKLTRRSSGLGDGNKNILGWFTHYHSIRIAGNVYRIPNESVYSVIMLI